MSLKEASWKKLRATLAQDTRETSERTFVMRDYKPVYRRPRYNEERFEHVCRTPPNVEFLRY
jgi:hypothetical protein